MTHSADPTPPATLLSIVRKNRSRFRWIGIALVVLGVLAILFPLVFSIAAKIGLGWFFLITGGLMLWHAFQAKEWGPALWSGLTALLHLALGVYLAFFALTGLVGLTLFLGFAFILQGAFEGMMALRHRPETGWGWLMTNGVVTAVLGVLLIIGLPGTALWGIGLLMGINFLMSGVAFLSLTAAADKQG
jgi:uncharacterized membrane protein HdeD (DUF308 family)